MRHPVLSDRRRLLIWGLAWLLLTAGQLLLYYYAYGGYTDIFIPDGIISMLLYSGLALSMWYPFRYFNTATTGLTAVLANIAAGGIFFVSVWILLTRVLVPLFIPKTYNFAGYWDVTFPYRVGTGVFIFLLIILTYYLFTSLFNLAEKKTKEAKLESLVKETELKMLRSQINPHFLFNSLNSISSLTITNPEKAREMVIKLSDFMRYSLSRKDEKPVTFRSELDNLRLYLDIEKVRFGDRLSIEEFIDGNCLEVNLPVMLLQPLYENAVKHGVYESTEKVSISTRAVIEEGFLTIAISNNYDSAPASLKGTGTGLLNVSRRLELFYGSKGFLQTSKEDGIFTVRLFIPVTEEPDEKGQNDNH
jgi:two-component system, LytTR family, sensor kinase